MANTTNEGLRAKFNHIQQTIATIIHKDVCTTGVTFFYGLRLPSNAGIEARLLASREEMPFNVLKGVRPFPPRP